MESPADKPKPAPLAISCLDTDCESGLHCFRTKRKLRDGRRNGKCRDCGIDLVDWKRVQQHDLADVSHTFASLKHELIRHHYWHNVIDPKASNYARHKGKKGLREAAEQRVRKSVAPAKPFRDGTQTPYEGNPLFYAQHATAACCRKCINEWHGIPEGRDLTEEEILYLTNLMMLYLNERLPQVTENGEKVPRRVT